jgi:DNA repair protein SbcD/Mre11
MPKFAHLSDVHVGAFRQPELKGLLLDAFDQAIDRCISEKVEFVVLAGDIFDSNLPDLASVRRAAAKMKEATEAGIRLYAIYGSHDFSPNYSSIVDVLNGAGLFTKVEVMSKADGKTTLSFVEDPSGPKLCGISGRKLSIDRDEYAVLDREALEKEPGLKIFVFHGALDETKPDSLKQMESMSAAELPSGFSYYAGGHVHSRSLSSLPGRPNVAYPGPLFATDYTELLELAHGSQRGFYVVEYDDRGVNHVEFAPVKVCDIVELTYSAEGKTSGEASEGLARLAASAKLQGKVALLTVGGRLSAGKTSDIDFFAVRKRLQASHPLMVLSNYSRLSSPEQAAGAGSPTPIHVTEREVFRREIVRTKFEEEKLRGEKGVDIALTLLRTLKEGKKENELRGDFEDRTSRAGLGVLGLEAED